MKLLEFFKYMFRGVFIQLFQDLREIFDVVTKKKTWVFICFSFLIISLFLGQSNLILLALILFLFFFVTYEWQVFNEQYIHQQREKYWRKPKIRG